jgi:hypothetical protein
MGFSKVCVIGILTFDFLSYSILAMYSVTEFITTQEKKKNKAQNFILSGQ